MSFESKHRRLEIEGARIIKKNKYSIDMDCVKVFSEIVKYYKSCYSEPIDKLKELLESMDLKIHDKTSRSQKSRQEEIEYPDNVNLYCPNYLTGLTKKDLKNIRKTMRL